MQDKKNVTFYKEKLGVGGVAFTMIAALLLYLIFPAVSYYGGWVIGHICGWLWGGVLINGVNALFKTSFSAEALPMIFGTLSMIASFFKVNVPDIDAFINDDEEEETKNVFEGNEDCADEKSTEASDCKR